MVIEANRYLPPDVLAALGNALESESSPAGREVLSQLLENADLAAETGLPLCQDTGAAVFFVQLGQGCRISQGSLPQAINAGMSKGYAQGYLRNSMCQPLSRENTGDNTPALIHTEVVQGAGLQIDFLAKGGGSENMSGCAMLKPAQGWEGVGSFVLDQVAAAGPNPCPPIIVGVGVGGCFDWAPMLAKKALLRSLDQPHPDRHLAGLERQLLARVNSLGIGPMGLGGDVTCLGVRLAMSPCHIASLPVAVNLQCHCARHARVSWP
jgi:fumarate hydratase subunit alpha